MDGRQWLRVDRFNDLSDEVVHHILSFLSIRDLACFGSASKRCKELCLSTPSLNFDELCHRDLSTSSKRLMLLSSLDRFLVRRGDEKLQQFRLVWDIEYFLVKEFSYEEEKFRVITWIHNAVKCNVEVLDLECGSFRMALTPFPSCVFLCRSLRSLMVDMKLMVFKEPSSASFSNLECLKLRNVKIADEGFFKWFSCYCNCIKELCLEQVSGVQNITIVSSSLLSFSFVNHSLTEQCQLSIAAEKLVDLVIDIKSIPHRKSINILAPNLTSMKWIGRLLIHQNLGEFIRLEKADLFFLKTGACDFGIVSEFLCSICRVKVLILNAESLKVKRYYSKTELIYLRCVSLFRENLILCNPLLFDCNLSSFEKKD